MSLHHVKGHAINTEHVCPPLPVRWFDWHAMHVNYELGCPIGQGETEQEAIDDLIEQLEDGT